MTQHSNAFRFSLNEQLWFQKGQEVIELIGIALEPDISIYDSEDYVTIRGVIELTGEYMPDKDGKDYDYSDQVVSFQERNSKSYIKDVRSFEDGLNEFHYNIPVEITIPKYRVPRIEDVMVEIDYFDYEIPSPSQLKLKADVVITGIQQEISNQVERKNTTEEHGARNNWEEVSQPFSFDLKFDEDESSSEFVESSSSSSLAENSFEIGRVEEKVEEPVENAQQLEESEKEREFWFKKKTQTFDEFFGKKVEEKEEVEQEWHDESSSISSTSYEVGSYDEPGMEYVPYEEDRPTIEYSVGPNDSPESSEDDSREDAIYLVNMFKGEENTYSKIRMCIVQETDTLDGIADRYKMSKTQLIRHNRLEDETIKAGEILYIPRQKQKDPS